MFNIFKKKELYEITYQSFGNSYREIIVAKNEAQAINYFYKKHKRDIYSITSFKKYNLES